MKVAAAEAQNKHQRAEGRVRVAPSVESGDKLASQNQLSCARQFVMLSRSLSPRSKRRFIVQTAAAAAKLLLRGNA